MTKILMIDDSLLSRGMGVDCLTKAGFEVIQAANGLLGYDAYQQHQPECIVTDLLMPVMDGIALLRKIRDKDSETPVVVVSADIQEATRKVCRELGISGFLNKPLDREALVSVVRESLKPKETAQ